MLTFLLGPHAGKKLFSKSAPPVPPPQRLLTRERLSPQELEDLFIQRMMDAFHVMPIGKGIITGAMDPHHTKGAIRAFALPMLSRPGDLEDAALRSNAYLSAYSPILTGTTVYSPSPVLTNLGKPSRAGSFSERGHPEKSIPLSANDFEVLRCLGQGSYGQVFLVRHVTTAQLLAMKVIDNRRLPFEKYGRIFEEQRIGKTLADSRWSLGIEGSFHDSNNFYLLFKYCTKGDLRRATWEDQNFFAQHPFKLIFAELILAIEELHSRRIIHRDIKLENILLDDHDHILLADFGISKSFGVDPKDRPWEAHPRWRRMTYAYRSTHSPTSYNLDNDMTCFAGGTPGYSAPEMFSGFYSYQVDIWAAGIVLFLLLFGCYPFGINPHHQSIIDIMQRTKSLRLTFPMEDYGLCPRTKDLLQQMLEKDPRRRITIQDIKKHPFFRSIDWAYVEERRPLSPFCELGRPLQPTDAGAKIGFGQAFTPGGMPYPWFDYTSPSVCPQNENDGTSSPTYPAPQYLGLPFQKSQPEAAFDRTQQAILGSNSGMMDLIMEACKRGKERRLGETRSMRNASFALPNNVSIGQS